jgi:hypothetical protein
MAVTLFNSNNQVALSLRQLADLTTEFNAKYGPPLRAIKISSTTASLIPLTTSVTPPIHAVPVDIDESLGLWEFKEVYD